MLPQYCCHHHPQLDGISSRLRAELRSECKDFCLRVACSKAAGERVTRSVALQHAFDAFSGDSKGLITQAKANARPELWAPAMCSLAVDVFVERSAERALLLARCGALLEFLCEPPPDAPEDAAKAAAKGETAAAVDLDRDPEQELLPSMTVGEALQQLASWSNCGCLKKHVCTHCGASDLIWNSHSGAEIASSTGIAGGYCEDIAAVPVAGMGMPPHVAEAAAASGYAIDDGSARWRGIDDEMKPRYCNTCRKDWTPASAPAAASAAAGGRGEGGGILAATAKRHAD